MVEVSVQEIIDKEYSGTFFDGYRGAFENKVYEEAVNKLESDDKEIIERIANRFDHRNSSSKKNDTIRLKNFGKLAALELTAKLGIFLNAVNYKGS